MTTERQSGMRFSAILLAGGMSRRMGQDKARLPWRGGTLWEHQLEILRNLGPEELMISCRPGQDYEAPGTLLIPDEQAGLGPLSGIAAALQRMQTEWLVVLAVDLPEMPARYLKTLLDRAHQSGKGMVPIRDGWYEPLAAVYPKACAKLASSQLREEDRSLQRLVTNARAGGLVEPVFVREDEAFIFHNLNESSDL